MGLEFICVHIFVLILFVLYLLFIHKYITLITEGNILQVFFSAITLPQCLWNHMNTSYLCTLSAISKCKSEVLFKAIAVFVGSRIGNLHSNVKLWIRMSCCVRLSTVNTIIVIIMYLCNKHFLNSIYVVI